MIKDLTHSRFTPSLLTHQALEAIFVRREDLAERLVNSVRESATTGSKHFILLHGPRGIGKTHLVSLVHGRIEADTELANQLRIAWLYEEEWGVASYVDLLRVILRALHEKYEDRELAAANEKLLEFSVEKAELEAEKLLLAFMGHRTLLILTENVDEIFEGLEEKGQKQFRALIQNNPIFTIVATARGLFEGVELRESPFYGFFNILPLDEFSADDATELLQKLAQQEGDPELVALLDQRQGRARIRALHYLAGGNPRIYVIFSQFLTRESLDSLVAAVMNTLDDLTSYYQERMARLTPQQRKIIQFLCDQQGAPTVTVIAGSNFITHQTASSQLKKLRELGYVRSEQRGRESYYELKEPLMRIALGVKKHRGEPLALLVEFLRIWYTRDELTLRIDKLTPEMTLDRSYLTHAIKAKDTEAIDPIVAACHKDYLQHIESGEFEKALLVAEDLTNLRSYAPDWLHRSVCLYKLGRNEEARYSLRQALALEPQNKWVWDTAGWMFLDLDCTDEALEAFDRCVEIDPTDADLWHSRGIALGRLERLDDAISSFNMVLELEPDNIAALHNLGYASLQLKQYENALVSFDKALELDPDKAFHWNSRGVTLGRLGRHDDALVSFEKALTIDPDNAQTHSNRGLALINLERYEDAIVAIDKALEIEPNNAMDWERRGNVLSTLGQHEKALASFAKATELAPNEKDLWMAHGFALIELDRDEESLTSFRRASDLDPSDAFSWKVQGTILWDLGRLDEACSSLKRQTQLPDSDAISWRDLAESQSVIGQQEDALLAFDRAFQMDPTCEDFSGLSHRGVAAMLSGRWEEGQENLHAGLALLVINRGSDPNDEVGIVRNMLLRTREQSIWRKHIIVWIELFSKYEVLSSLGQGLVRSIQTFQISWIDQNAKQAWYDVWRELAGDYKEMGLPLRLLKTAVEYHEEKDDRVLFQLPMEERRLLEPLLGIKN